MRRQVIYLPEDARTEEVTEMAAAVGCFVRYANNCVVLDRIPNWLKQPDEPNVVRLPARMKKVAR